MEKIVCYFMTRNIYADVIPSLKSLLKNGNIDRVILMAEDDDIGIDLPARVDVRNVTEWRDKLLDPDGPNYYSRWTWMVMMKVALCYILPNETRALTLDMDTIVRGDISGLWDLRLDDHYFAGVKEPFWTERLHRNYVNCGVLMWNLERMRTGMADAVLRVLNRMKYTFPEQDCLNDVCRGQFLVIDPVYNVGEWTERTKDDAKIRHHMASKGMWKAEPEVLAYKDMSWEGVFADG